MPLPAADTVTPRSQSVPLPPATSLQPGQRVRVKSGSLMGLEGVVLSSSGDNGLLIAVNCQEKGISLLIRDYQLEPI